MTRLLFIILVVALALGGCVPLSMHGALREALDRAEAEKEAAKKETAEALAETRRLQAETAPLKAAPEALSKQVRELTANLQQANQERIALAEQLASVKALLAAREAEKAALAAKEAEKPAQAAQIAKPAEMQTLTTRFAAPKPALPVETERQRAVRLLEAALIEEIAKGSAVVKPGENALTLELLENALFYNSASATIRPEGLKLLKRIAQILQQGSDKEIRVESHTDVQIHTDRFPSNATLAVARANGVARFLKAQSGMAAARVFAVGYADPKPSGGAGGIGGHNRRVEVIVGFK